MNLQAGLAKAETLAGQITWGVASAASDILKAVTPIFIAWAISQRDWLRIMAGVALLAVTGGYAVVSAISYSHASRVDTAGARGAEAAAHERATTAYRSASNALAGLPVARPAAELEASIAGLLADPRAGDCRTIDGPVSRRICPQVAELRVELGRAVERARLQGELERAKERLDGLPAPRIADPAAEAVARFLGEIGVTVPSEIALWLSLSGVILVEVGSMFGLLLASGGATAFPPVVPFPAPGEGQAPQRLNGSTGGVGKSSPPKAKRGRRPRTAVALGKLKALAHDGKVEASQAALGAALGVSKATAHRELRRLARSGAVSLTTGRRGTLVTIQ
jgi:Uncharacterized membrane-associated protein/domain